MDRYLITLWFALFIAHQFDQTVKRFQSRKRRKMIALRLKSLTEKVG
jgi:hypothetical protein